MLTKETATRTEAESIGALNDLLSKFEREFDPIVSDAYFFGPLTTPERTEETRIEERTEETRIEDGASVLAKYHLQVVDIVNSVDSLRKPMVLWSSTGGNNAQSRYFLKRAGVGNPYNLGYLWGLGVEKSMAKRFAEELQKSKYYQPTSENPRGRDLPMQLWKLVP